MVHNLDRATWVLGETPPQWCFGLGGRSGAQTLLGDVFDHHTVVYHYANGVRLYGHCRKIFRLGDAGDCKSTDCKPARWRRVADAVSWLADQRSGR